MKNMEDKKHVKNLSPQHLFCTSPPKIPGNDAGGRLHHRPTPSAEAVFGEKSYTKLRSSCRESSPPPSESSCSNKVRGSSTGSLTSMLNNYQNQMEKRSEVPPPTTRMRATVINGCKHYPPRTCEIVIIMPQSHVLGTSNVTHVAPWVLKTGLGDLEATLPKQTTRSDVDPVLINVFIQAA